MTLSVYHCFCTILQSWLTKPVCFEHMTVNKNWTVLIAKFSLGGSPKSQTDTRKSPMPLQPRPDLSQPVEESTSQSTVPVIQHKAIILTVEDVPIVRTPKRQSYLPAVPSPLLQDSTPQPRFTRSLLKTTPSLKQMEDITTEKDTPRHRRQSLRLET